MLQIAGTCGTQGSHRGKVDALYADQLQLGLHLKPQQILVSANLLMLCCGALKSFTEVRLCVGKS